MRGEQIRKAHDRQRADGTSTLVRKAIIPSHFSHRASKGENSDLTCELRVNSLSKSEIDRLAIKGHQQLVTKLHKYFWKILSQSPKMQECDCKLKQLHDCLEGAMVIDRLNGKKVPLKKVYRETIVSICQLLCHPWYRQEVEQNGTKGIGKWVEDINKALLDVFNPLPKEVAQYFKSFSVFSQPFDLDQQAKIVSEAWGFLTQPRQKQLFFKLVELGLISWISVIHYGQDNSHQKNYSLTEAILYSDFPFLPTQNSQRLYETLQMFFEVHYQFIKNPQDEGARKNFNAPFAWIKDDICQTLAFTDWAEGFSKIDSLSEKEVG